MNYPTGCPMLPGPNLKLLHCLAFRPTHKIPSCGHMLPVFDIEPSFIKFLVEPIPTYLNNTNYTLPKRIFFIFRGQYSANNLEQLLPWRIRIVFQRVF